MVLRPVAGGLVAAALVAETALVTGAVLVTGTGAVAVDPAGPDVVAERDAGVLSDAEVLS